MEGTLVNTSKEFDGQLILSCSTDSQHRRQPMPLVEFLSALGKYEAGCNASVDVEELITPFLLRQRKRQSINATAMHWKLILLGEEYNSTVSLQSSNIAGWVRQRLSDAKKHGAGIVRLQQRETSTRSQLKVCVRSFPSSSPCSDSTRLQAQGASAILLSVQIEGDSCPTRRIQPTSSQVRQYLRLFPNCIPVLLLYHSSVASPQDVIDYYGEELSGEHRSTIAVQLDPSFSVLGTCTSHRNTLCDAVRWLAQKCPVAPTLLRTTLRHEIERYHHKCLNEAGLGVSLSSMRQDRDCKSLQTGRRRQNAPPPVTLVKVFNSSINILAESLLRKSRTDNTPAAVFPAPEFVLRQMSSLDAEDDLWSIADGCDALVPDPSDAAFDDGASRY